MIFVKKQNNPPTFTQTTFIDRKKRAVELNPSDILFKDYRYILDVTKWENVIVDFPLEINCKSGSKIYIDNCEFRGLLIINLDYGISIDSIFIFGTDIRKALKIYGSDHTGNEVRENISIDSCIIDKTEFLQLNSDKIDIYNTKLTELHIEAISANDFHIKRSDIGIILEHSTKILNIDIQDGTFDNQKIIPSNLFKELKKRYKDKKTAIDASLRAIDFLLRNKNIILPSYVISGLYYERNRIQTESILSGLILWSFGYFQSPLRYLTSAIITYALVSGLLGFSMLLSGTYSSVEEILRIAFSAFIGLSYTISGESDYITSIIVSFAIGLGTVFYSGLLVTLINRFKIRF